MADGSDKLLDKDALIERRKHAKLPPAEEGKQLWGLALSGGGIRSSTFCFGLLRGLARAKSLKRFDYLSTVSGGGYIGAAFGRLFAPSQGADKVQERLGEGDTLLLWWLRNNGRYLTPAGARDITQALASILRNTLYSLLEAGVLILLGVGVMLLPYVIMALFRWDPGEAGPSAWPVHAQSAIGSAWLYFIIVPLLVGSHSIFGYWYSRDKPVVAAAVRWGSGLALLAALGFAIGASAAAWSFAYVTIALLLVTPATAFALHDDKKDQGELRLQHTKRLGWCLVGLGALLAVAALDWLSAWAASWLIDNERRGFAAGTSGLVTAAVIALARTYLPGLMKLMQSAKPRRIPLATIMNVVGLLVLALYVLFWATAFQLFVRPEPWAWWPPLDGLNSSVPHWLAIMVLAGLFTWLTAPDVDSLNLSSLHNFYRARLERAYVSTGNWAREMGRARFPESPLGPVSREATNKVAKLVEAVPGDDVFLRAYRPHEYGGPIHLMTCCVNQTVDDRTGLYNADRKGMALTVSSLGVETGTHGAVPLAELCDRPNDDDVNAQIDGKVGRLSRWVAISGAAAGSGMGSQTTPGLAALLFLSGVRLGFWSGNLLPHAQRKEGKDVHAAERRFAKQTYLAGELLARFPGLGSPNWYVSDGGHFENTAVYPLLKRRVGFILVADCGADPEFGFEDVENLVRKAKIDYGASIEFVGPTFLEKGGMDPAFAAHCGKLADMTKQEGSRAVLVARVRYADGSRGVLAIVKPRCLADAPLEVKGYAARNAAFPQQTTADQFFDEAQWEAYHQLGLFIGTWFTPPAIAKLVASVTQRTAPAAAATPAGAAAAAK